MLTNAYEIPFALAAGASLVLPAGSFEFVYLSSISAGASVRLKGSQVSIDLIVGRRVEFGNPTVQPLTLENKGSGSVSGVLLVGSGDVRDSNVVGTVSVTNADKDRSVSGVSFFGSRNVSAVASQYSIAYLINPVGSGVNLIVNRMSATQPAGAGGVFYYFSTDDVAGLEALPAVTPLSRVAGINKLIGGDVANGERTGANSTSGVAGSVDVLGFIYMGVPGFHFLDVSEPYIVQPGGALGAASSTVADDLSVSFEWFEESI